MMLLYTLGVALGAAFLFERLGVPAGALVGAMLGVGMLRVFGVETVQMPAAGRFLVFAVVGWLLGQSFNRDTPRVVAAAAVPIIIVVLAFLLIGAVFALLLWRFGELDPITAYLATAPGGIAQIGVLSAAVGAQVPLVLSVHLLRVTSVILLTPLVARLLRAGP